MRWGGRTEGNDPSRPNPTRPSQARPVAAEGTKGEGVLEALGEAVALERDGGATVWEGRRRGVLKDMRGCWGVLL